MHHAGYRSAPAAADVGRSPHDGAGSGNAAKKWRHHVGDALRHQLLIGIVAVVDHAVGHHRRKQRFNRRQQRDGDSRTDKLLD